MALRHYLTIRIEEKKEDKPEIHAALILPAFFNSAFTRFRSQLKRFVPKYAEDLNVLIHLMHSSLKDIPHHDDGRLQPALANLQKIEINTVSGEFNHTVREEINAFLQDVQVYISLVNPDIKNMCLLDPSKNEQAIVIEVQTPKHVRRLAEVYDEARDREKLLETRFLHELAKELGVIFKPDHPKFKIYQERIVNPLLAYLGDLGKHVGATSDFKGEKPTLFGFFNLMNHLQGIFENEIEKQVEPEKRVLLKEVFSTIREKIKTYIRLAHYSVNERFQERLNKKNDAIDMFKNLKVTSQAKSILFGCYVVPQKLLTVFDGCSFFRNDKYVELGEGRARGDYNAWCAPVRHTQALWQNAKYYQEKIDELNAVNPEEPKAGPSQQQRMR